MPDFKHPNKFFVELSGEEMFQLSDYDKIIVYYDKPEQKGVYAAYVADNDDDEDFPEDPLDIGLLHLSCIFKLSEDGKNWENLGVILENSDYDDDECYDMDFDYDFVGNIFKLKENELPKEEEVSLDTLKSYWIK